MVYSSAGRYRGAVHPIMKLLGKSLAWSVGCALILQAAFGQAQNGASARISPVPLWPLDGNRTGEYLKYSVFINPEAAEIVVVLPDSSSAPGERVLRYGNPAEVSASISVHIAHGAIAHDQYIYTVDEADRSRKRVNRVRLLLPQNDQSLASDSSVWSAASEGTELPDRATLTPAARMRLLTWTNPAIQPAPVRGVGLRLSSSLLPGFTEAFVQGKVAHELTLQDVASFPDTIAASARVLLQPEWSSQRSLVLAPLFAADAPKKFIAENYYYGISRLSQTDSLDSNSSFVKAVLSLLDAYLRGNSSVFSTSDLNPLAPTALEREIATALQIAFGQ